MSLCFTFSSGLCFNDKTKQRCVSAVSVIRALCFLSLKQYRDAIRDCSDALRMDGSNVKALYRRAQAHKELKVSSPSVSDRQAAAACPQTSRCLQPL